MKRKMDATGQPETHTIILPQRVTLHCETVSGYMVIHFAKVQRVSEGFTASLDATAW